MLDIYLLSKKLLDFVVEKLMRLVGWLIFVVMDLLMMYEERCFFVFSGDRYKSSESLLRDMCE